MHRRPIGVFDSGLGGISVLAEAMRLLPTEDFIYFGDTGHAPYGDKKPEEVLARTHDILDSLITSGCKAIIIACNTATSVAGTLRQELTLPVIGMEPALKPAAMMSGEGNILVLATQMTLSQPKFSRLMERYGKDAIPVPCPGLMERVEAGETDGEHVKQYLEELLLPYASQNVKAVVLGCTHYVFLRKPISEVLGSKIPLVDGNQGTVRHLMSRLSEEGLLNPEDGKPGSVVFQTSASKEAEALERMRGMLALAQRMAGQAAVPLR